VGLLPWRFGRAVRRLVAVGFLVCGPPGDVFVAGVLDAAQGAVEREGRIGQRHARDLKLRGFAALGGKPTKFQIACMTLPYSPFPLDRALSGIKHAGYKYVPWGTAHQEADGNQAPHRPAEAPRQKSN